MTSPSSPSRSASQTRKRSRVSSWSPRKTSSPRLPLLQTLTTRAEISSAAKRVSVSSSGFGAMIERVRTGRGVSPNLAAKARESLTPGNDNSSSKRSPSTV